MASNFREVVGKSVSDADLSPPFPPLNRCFNEPEIFLPKIVEKIIYIYIIKTLVIT